jgi:hypothetical protein
MRIDNPYPPAVHENLLYLSTLFHDMSAIIDRVTTFVDEFGREPIKGMIESTPDTELALRLLAKTIAQRIVSQDRLSQHDPRILWAMQDVVYRVLCFKIYKKQIAFAPRGAFPPGVSFMYPKRDF